jgi:hypothetical protein
MKFASRLEGLDVFRSALARIADEDELSRHLEASAREVEEAARANLDDGRPPESRSGALAASLAVSLASDGKSASVGTPLDYGWHLEFGALARPAEPWLSPALDGKRPGILARLRNWLSGASR